MDQSRTAAGNLNLKKKYFQLAGVQTTVDLKQKLLLAKSYFEESYRIYSKIYGPTHTKTIYAAFKLATVVRELSEIELL
jgi:hypothetical protein